MNGPFAVFHVDSERALKGGERQLLYLAFQLRALGHWNCIVCRKGSQLDIAGRKAGFDVMYLPFLFEWDPLSALMLRGQIMLRQRPGGVVIHAHSSHAAAVSFMAAKAGFARRIVSRRDEYPLSGSASARMKYASAHKVVAASENIRKMLLKSGVPQPGVELVLDCIPETGFPWDDDGLDKFRAAARQRLFSELDIPPDSFCVGAITGFESQRDPLTFVRAVPLVLQEVPWTHFVISGSGPLLGEIRRLALELKVPHRLHVIGNYEEPLALMAAFDVLSVASRGEGIGGSVLESMSAGTPVVSVRGACAQEIISDGEDGFMVNPSSPAELARIIAKLLKSPELCRALRGRGFQRRKRFLSKAAAERMVEIYGENNPCPHSA
ncbi:MAG: glycosyltransferase family 4 protein [Elusimicrobiales bacterium]